jgi:hypothetical protein
MTGNREKKREIREKKRENDSSGQIFPDIVPAAQMSPRYCPGARMTPGSLNREKALK